MSTADLARLEELAAKAAPGRLRLRYLRGRHSVRSLSICVDDEQPKTDDVLPLADVWLPLPWRGGSGEERGRVAEMKADALAALIVEAVNSLPLLLEAIKRVRTYCQDVLEIFLREGIDSPPAVSVADVLKMLDGTDA